MMGGMGQLYEGREAPKIPPIDLPLSAAVLRDRKLPVNVIDCLASQLETAGLLSALAATDQKYIAIRTSTPTFDWDMTVARLVKTFTRSELIIFGSHVAECPQAVMQRPFIDAAIVGEPELVFPEIVEANGFGSCEGVWYRKNGQTIDGGRRQMIEDLDNLPFPAWDLLPYRHYDGMGLMRNVRPFVVALTSRGCPHACGYCPYPVAQGRKLRVRSPENVVDELVWLSDALEVKAVLFRDPEFALQRERVVGICRGILARKVRMTWRCETRMEDLDTDLLELMARAGCIGINIGIESADPQVLERMYRKALPFERSRGIIDACRRYGIDTFCFFILGLPGEDRHSALATIDYAVKLNPSVVQFTAATPYPGTALRKWAVEGGYIKDTELASLTSYKATMGNEHLSAEEIQELLRYSREALTMRWKPMARRILGGLRRTALDGANCIGFHAKRLIDHRFKRAR